MTPETLRDPLCLTYRIDAANRILWVNEAWSDFARANNGENMLPERVLGADLLASIADRTVRELYASMIRRARVGRPVQFNYRCDAPDKRRLFTMKIGALANGEVEFSSTLLSEESRPSIPLLEPGGRRSQTFLRVCSWCQRIALPSGEWVEAEEAVSAQQVMEADEIPAISHTICESCHLDMMEKLALSF